MRFNALKQISRAKTQSSKKEGAKLLAEALTAEQGAARGEAALLARSHRRAARLLLLQVFIFIYLYTQIYVYICVNIYIYIYTYKFKPSRRAPTPAPDIYIYISAYTNICM